MGLNYVRVCLCIGRVFVFYFYGSYVSTSAAYNNKTSSIFNWRYRFFLFALMRFQYIWVLARKRVKTSVHQIIVHHEQLIIVFIESTGNQSVWSGIFRKKHSIRKNKKKITKIVNEIGEFCESKLGQAKTIVYIRHFYWIINPNTKTNIKNN